MWIEVWVEDDDSIRGIKVDTNAASPCGQKVDKDTRVGLVEFINALLPERAWRITVLREAVSDHEMYSELPVPVEDV